MNIRKYLYNRSEKVLGTYIFTYTHFYIHVKLCMCYYTVYTFIVHSMEDGRWKSFRGLSLLGRCAHTYTPVFSGLFRFKKTFSFVRWLMYVLICNVVVSCVYTRAGFHVPRTINKCNLIKLSFNNYFLTGFSPQLVADPCLNSLFHWLIFPSEEIWVWAYLW